MTEIVPKLLWIGTAMEVRQISQVLEAGIEALVDLAMEERPPSKPLSHCSRSRFRHWCIAAGA